jgi:hypothetical protein
MNSVTNLEQMPSIAGFFGYHNTGSCISLLTSDLSDPLLSLLDKPFKTVTKNEQILDRVALRSN